MHNNNEYFFNVQGAWVEKMDLGLKMFQCSAIIQNDILAKKG